MKFTKLSLAALAAMSIASSAFAVENVKVDGQIKLWYQTLSTSAANSADLLERASAKGDLVANVGVAGDLTKNVSAGFKMYAVSTMGLENNLVSNEAITLGNTSTTAGGVNGNENLPMWLGEAFFVYKAGNTIVKVGRQALDTPLAYTETWNAAPNTFEAAVLINKDIPNTTLVAGYVAKGNGYSGTSIAANGGTVNSKFSNYHANNTALEAAAVAALGVTAAQATAAVGNDAGGAYALGMVNTSIPTLTLHPVYYDVVDTATAFWVDATLTAIPGVKIQALYANVDASGTTEKALKTLGVTERTTDAYAAMVSGSVAGFNLGASYSSVGEGYLPVGNTATGFKKTKIYTASIFSDGEVAGRPDTTGWKLEASTKLSGFDLGASYGSYSVGKNNNNPNWFTGVAAPVSYDPAELDLSVGTKVGDINVTAYYINQTEYTKTAAGVSTDRDAIRVIANINF